jgi:hypothetical protein
MIITTEGGTTFHVANGVVTITRGDQPECSIPLADLREFAELIIDIVDVDEDLEGDDLE